MYRAKFLYMAETNRGTDGETIYVTVPLKNTFLIQRYSSFLTN